jgi:hypothetical protein
MAKLKHSTKKIMFLIILFNWWFVKSKTKKFEHGITEIKRFKGLHSGVGWINDGFLYHCVNVFSKRPEQFSLMCSGIQKSLKTIQK